MANLDEAAGRALDTVNGLLAAAEDTRARLVEMRERIEQTSQRIDGEWSMIRERARVFLEQTITEDQQVVAAVAEANRGLDTLRSAFGHLEEEAPVEMATTREEFDLLAEAVGSIEPQLDGALEEAEAVEAALSAKVDHVQTEIEGALTEASELLADALLAELKQLETEAEQETIELNAYFASQSLPALTTKSQELYDQLVQAEEDMRLALETAGADSEAVTETALRECEQRYDDELTDLDRLSASLEEALGDLRDFVDEGLEGIDDRKDRWDDSIRGAQGSLKEALEALRELEDYLRRFAFMR